MTRTAALALALALVACSPTLVDVGVDDVDPGLAAGAGVTCFLPSASGQLRCVGLGDRGQLARDPADLAERCDGRACTTTPVFGGLVGAPPMVFGLDFGCAARPDDILCFGDAGVGQLGGGARDDVPQPLPRSVGLTGTPVALAAGRTHACALTDDGALACWGDGSHGQLGRAPATLDDCGAVADEEEAARFALPVGATIRCTATPVRIEGIPRASAVWAGGWGTCLRDDDGEVRCMGRLAAGSLPLDGSDRDVVAPERATAMAGALELALGARHGCARFPGGAVRCFGSGPGAATGPLPDDAIALAIGDDVTYALRSDHQLAAVGLDDRGQLGDGPGAAGMCDGRACSTAAVSVALPRRAVQIVAGARHACALLTDERIVCWGEGREGALGDAQGDDAFTPVVLEGLRSPP